MKVTSDEIEQTALYIGIYHRFKLNFFIVPVLNYFNTLK